MFRIDILRTNIEPESIYIYGEKSLLVELEERSILPNHSCRAGHCGSCIATVISGEVIQSNCLYPLSDNEVLICRAKPASDICLQLD